MTKATTASAIRRTLTDGPATSREIAVSLEMDRNLICMHLSSLKRCGQVKVLGRAPHTKGPPPQIYALTKWGERLAEHDAQKVLREERWHCGLSMTPGDAAGRVKR